MQQSCEIKGNFIITNTNEAVKVIIMQHQALLLVDDLALLLLAQLVYLMLFLQGFI